MRVGAARRGRRAAADLANLATADAGTVAGDVAADAVGADARLAFVGIRASGTEVFFAARSRLAPGASTLGVAAAAGMTRGLAWVTGIGRTADVRCFLAHAVFAGLGRDDLTALAATLLAIGSVRMQAAPPPAITKSVPAATLRWLRQTLALHDRRGPARQRRARAHLSSHVARLTGSRAGTVAADTVYAFAAAALFVTATGLPK